MPTHAYMIRRMSDGLFSTGGASPRFTKTGKIWKNLNNLHNHLALFRYYSINIEGRRIEDYVNGVWLLPKQYRDCEIVKVALCLDKATDLKQYCKDLKPEAQGL